MAQAGGVRARVRAELIQEIKDEARRQVAEGGASALSLRAVARHLGMVSSGIYRYFESRDQLLTALIIDAYNDVGRAAEVADATCDRADVIGRWRAACRAIRAWALEHPHEYALVYGTPVPGYRAPEDTVGPASRVTRVLATVAHDAAAAGALAAPFVPERQPPLSDPAAAEAARLGGLVMPGVPGDAVVRAVAAWTEVFGFVSFELFGHLHGVLEDADAVFEQTVADIGAFVGLVETPAPG